MTSNNSPIISNRSDNSNNNWIVIIVVVCLLLLCCCAVITLLGFYFASQTSTNSIVTTTPTTTPKVAPVNTTLITPSITRNPTTPAVTLPAASSKIYKMGDVATLDNISLTVYSIDNNVISGIEYVKPDTGNKFVAVNVQVTNSGTTDYIANSLDFILVDQQQNSYSSDLGIKNPYLAVEIVKPGKSVSGWITFQVPTSASNLSLVYQPISDYTKGTTHTITVNLY